MTIRRTIPPAAAPLYAKDLWHALIGIWSPARCIRALEDDVRDHFGVPHVFLVSSGTAALTLTLIALKAGSPRTHVVIPAYTCFSVPAAVLKAGLQPVLCDIKPATFDFDHALLEQTLTANTLCVIAHHLFGVPSDIERIRRICAVRKIRVIEDAAQAMGGQLNGRQLGTVGDVGIFSLGRGKNITCGSGGIIVTNSDQLAQAIAREYRQLPGASVRDTLKDLAQVVFMAIFIRPRLYWIPAALPFLRLGQTIFPKEIPLRRLSGMKAGLLRHWRSRLTSANRVRSETVGYFTGRFGRPLVQGEVHPCVRLPVLVSTPEERGRIYSEAQRRGLGLSVAYPTAISEVPEMRDSFDGKRFPSAEKVARTLLTIPTHQWLGEEDKHAIAELCRAYPPA